MIKSNKKVSIAIIMFPGSNDHENSKLACEAVGMEADIVRWNESPDILEKYDGYILPGGWSYEDRIRAGAIASKDPIMSKVKAESEKGKVVLGICNGAQILIETGIIPGLSGKVEMALAPNINPKVAGYYCTWIKLKSNQLVENAFNFGVDEVFDIPVAHGEGRFVSKVEGIFDDLERTGQIVFKYCDLNGVVSEKFPICPNGSTNAVAGICNKKGNVLAMMPHPERCTWNKQLRQFDSQLDDGLGPGASIFASVKKWIEYGRS